MLQPWTIMPSKEEFFEVWNSGVTAGDICEHFGISHDELVRIAQRYRLKYARRLAEVDPSADEIRERAAIVRLKWSPAEELRRRGGRGPLEFPRAKSPSWLA
jgi:hypothetical protein